MAPKRKPTATPSATPALAFKSPAVQRGVVTPSPQRSVNFSVQAEDESEPDDVDEEEDEMPPSDSFDPLSPPVPKSKRGRGDGSDPARKMTSDADMEAAEALAGLRGEEDEPAPTKKGKGRAKPVKETAVSLPNGRKLGTRRSAAEKKAAAARLGPIDASAPVAGPSKSKPASKAKPKAKKAAEPESSRPRRGAVKAPVVDVTLAELDAQAEAEMIGSEEDSAAEDAIPDPAAAAAARKKAAAVESKKRKTAESASSSKRPKSQSASVLAAPAEPAPTSSDEDDEDVEMEAVDPTPAAPPAGQSHAEAPPSDASAGPEQTQQPDAEEEASDSDSDDGETFERSQYAARTRIVDGQMVIDEDSLQVERAHETTATGEVIQDDLRGRLINSATYGKRTSAGRWHADETDRFYTLLAQFGQNFDMISTLLPGRSRSMCIRKFNAEDKTNRARVNAALKATTPIDKTMLLDKYNIDLDAPLPNAKEPTPAPATKPKKRKGKKSKEVVEPPVEQEAEPAPEAQEPAPTAIKEPPLFNPDSDDEVDCDDCVPQIQTTR